MVPPTVDWTFQHQLTSDNYLDMSTGQSYVDSPSMRWLKLTSTLCQDVSTIPYISFHLLSTLGGFSECKWPHGAPLVFFKFSSSPLGFSHTVCRKTWGLTCGTLTFFYKKNWVDKEGRTAAASGFSIVRTDIGTQETWKEKWGVWTSGRGLRVGDKNMRELTFSGESTARCLLSTELRCPACTHALIHGSVLPSDGVS